MATTTNTSASNSAGATTAEQKSEQVATAQTGEKSATEKQTKMPTLFMAHGGGPCFFMESRGPDDMFAAMDKNSKAANFYRGLTKQMKLPKPKAIVVASAHWETRDTIRVTSQKKHPTLLYDYYGFPDYTYEIKYDAPGSPELAKQIVGLLQKAGFKAEEDTKRNFDHGVFVPLKLIFPDADVPIVQVSLLATLDPKTHLKIGEALASLRDQGVLIFGSGSTTHDLSFRLKPAQGKAFVGALDKALKLDGASRTEKLVKWAELPNARQAHPREEHLIPLHVAVGAAGEGSKAEQLGDFWAQALSLTSWRFD